ncbi:MAG: hypothetical protein GXP53_11970 [Deltaproteobacteria bacterium]|nr:hypothetical protein [Deltaproteobacteria bacterium]
MWGCSYFPNYLQMGGFFPHGILRLFIYGLIILLLVSIGMKLLSFIKHQSSRDRDRFDSLSILKTRYAKGEVSEDEYARMKEILLRS